MKKKLFFTSALVIVVALSLFVLSACNVSEIPYDQELVVNGAFEEFSAPSSSSSKIVLNGWNYSKEWRVSEYGKDNNKNDNSSCLYISNSAEYYAYLYQQIKVDRKAIYKVSVDVKVLNAIKKGSDEKYNGATVTFLENMDYLFVNQTDSTINDETANWKTYTFYVRPTDTDYLTLCLSLGSENARSSGKVYFDNVSMKKVENVAEGQKVYDFKKASTVRYNQDVSGITFTVMLTLFGAFALVAAYTLIRRLYSRPTAFLNFSQINGGVSKAGAITGEGTSVFSNPWFIGSMLALGTFIVNLIFLLSMYGFGSEMTNTVTAALALGKANGVRNAFASQIVGSNSPGAIYILAIIGAMGKNLDYYGVSVLIRMVNVLATMATVVMIYLYGRKHVGDRQSTIFAALYALLPITFVMSGLEHMFTALLVALIVAAFYLLSEKKHLAVYLVMTLAVLLDVRALAVAPLIISCLVYRYIRADKDIKEFNSARAKIVFGFVACFVLLYILTIPAAIDFIAAENSKPFYGFTLIANEVTLNSIFVDNAIGLYGLATLNQKTSSQTASILNLVFVLVLEAYVISLYVKNRNKQELIMLGSFMFAIVAVFTLKTTYTHLFLAIALGLIYAMVSGEKRMYGIVAGYSLLGFVNVATLINNSGFVVGKSYFDSLLTTGTSAYFEDFETTSPEFIVFSVFAVILTIYYAYVSYSITNNGKIVDVPPMYKTVKETAKEWFTDFGGKFRSLFAKDSND